MKKLNEVYNEWKSNKGFFHFLYYYFSHASPVIECPFLPDSGTAELLDMKYHGGFSGRKIVSTFVDAYLDDFDSMQDAYFVRFAEIFWKLSGENLTREFEIMSAEYNPLNNYDMHETLSENRSGNHADTSQSINAVEHTGFDKVSTERDETVSTDSDSTHNINGFDSVGDGVQADSTTDSAETHTTADHTKNYVQTDYDNTQTTTGNTNNSGTTAETVQHVLDRAGNIGVTTSVQMLSGHSDFWQNWRFYEKVLFPAVDRLLTIPLY